MLLDRLLRLLVVAALVLDPEGVATGGNLTSSLPSTVAGFKRRKVAADSGPDRVKGAAGVQEKSYQVTRERENEKSTNFF